MDIHCHCRKVSIRLPGQPLKLNRCTCSICRRYGALWSYYPPESVLISGATDTYIWGDKMIAFHRCQCCGVLTHWMHIDGDIGDIGVNLQNSDPALLDGIAEYDGHMKAI